MNAVVVLLCAVFIAIYLFRLFDKCFALFHKLKLNKSKRNIYYAQMNKAEMALVQTTAMCMHNVKKMISQLEFCFQIDAVQNVATPCKRFGRTTIRLNA